MLFAAGMLTWMIFWMQKQGKNLKQEIEQEVQTIASQKGNSAVFLLTFTSVLREGVELAIFLLAAQASASSVQTDLGVSLGLGVAVLLGWLLFSTTYRLNLRQFFRITNVLLILFSAGLVAHGVHELNEIGWIPSLIEPVWNINPVLLEDSTIGLLLKSLFGYNGDPSLTEILAYFGYFAALFFGMRLRISEKRELDHIAPR